MQNALGMDGLLDGLLGVAGILSNNYEMDQQASFPTGLQFSTSKCFLSEKRPEKVRADGTKYLTI